ncbi:hypothetical protein J2755_001002 [Methanohalophilus levihalophilus]|uniref:hypothetical protein n=1 Tax=Methanohalophilus levihalophilus TaxID=1431282 RepID=UPI001AE19CB6|nr:hypothetical protein [Methanohalophilus levihalophilus]MBP2030068.1 hypothetical protein [Methanohalophilus levihalophilus]
MREICDFSWKDCKDLALDKHDGIVGIPLLVESRDPHQYALNEIKANMVVDDFKNKISRTLSEKRAMLD